MQKAGYYVRLSLYELAEICQAFFNAIKHNVDDRDGKRKLLRRVELGMKLTSSYLNSLADQLENNKQKNVRIVATFFATNNPTLA